MPTWCCKLKKNKSIVLPGIFLAVLFSSVLTAGTSTETLQFLKIKPSARATSLGDSFVSIANDVNAAFYKPAGVGQLDSPEISLMHMVYMADTSYEFGALVLPVGDKLRLGAYVVFLNYGSMVKTTEDLSGLLLSSSGSSYAPYDLSAAVSVGYKISKDFNVGFNLKMAISEIDGSSLNGIMGDVGVLLKLTEETGLGCAVYNISGVMLNGDTAPLTGRLGLSTKFSLVEQNDLTVGVGCNYVPANAKLSESIGVEYYYQGMFCIRGGYGIGSDIEGLNAGAGIRQDLGGMTGTLDYNFSMLGDLGSAHRVSIGIKFGPENTDKSKVRSNNKGQYSIKKGY